MKRGLIFLAVVLLVGFVSASSVLNIELTKYNYSVDSVFQGNITIDDESVLANEILSGDISSCGSYDEKEISIYDLLINSGETLGPAEVFSAGSSSTAYPMSLGDNGSSLVGFKVDNTISKFNFSISGGASGVKFDVGADGDYDWSYIGEETGWGSLILPYDYGGNTELPGDVDYNPHTLNACSKFNITLDEFVSELKVNVKGIAKNSGGSGSLEAKILGKKCTFETVPPSYGDVECNITLDVEDYEDSIEFEACIIATIDQFRVPRKSYNGVDYYYFGVEKRLYDSSLSSTKFYVSDEGLLNTMDGFCDGVFGECFIPIEVNAVDAGEVNFNDLYLEYGAPSTVKFYSVDSSTLELNLSNKSIPLNSFVNLKTPIVEDRADCILKLKFGSDDDSVAFGVSAGPTSVIDVSSLYMAKNFDIVFDGSYSSVENNRSIVSYNWDFGDNSTGSGERVSHKYLFEGDYTVTLKVKDSSGIEGASSIDVHIVPLEEHLDNQFLDLESGIVSSLSLSSLIGEEKSFYDFMGYDSLINNSIAKIDSLKSNFTSLKAGNLSNKDAKYVLIVNDLHGITSSLPISVDKISSRDIDNLALFNPDEIFNYGGVSSYTSAYINELFKFNVDNVKVDMDSTLFYVDYFEGSTNFLRVEKDITITGGTNNIIVEDLRNVVADLDNSVGGTPRNNSKVLTWSGSVSSIDYVVETNELSNIKTIVFTDLEIAGDDTYCLNDSSCEFYCGDGVCTTANYLGVDERDELNSNYCPTDCVQETSKVLYIVLLIVFVLFVLFILFYHGPGSLKGKISPKPVFVSEKDRSVLNNFIYNALNKGHSKDQVRDALVKKGWSANKVDQIMKDYLRERLRGAVK